MSHRILLPAAALVSALALGALPAAAAPAPSANPPAKVRVHVDTEAFGFTHINPVEDGNLEATNTNVVGFGVGRPSYVDGSQVFLDRPVLGIGVGGLILGGRAVVGARVAFVVDGFLQDGDNTTAVGGRLVPYFNYMFGPYGRLRPYIGAHFGFGGGSITFDEDLGEAIGRARIGVIYPIVGPQGGVHVFLADRVSLDAGLVFDYLAPHTQTVQLEPDPPPDADEGFDHESNVFNVAIALGLSAWF